MRDRAIVFVAVVVHSALEWKRVFGVVSGGREAYARIGSTDSLLDASVRNAHETARGVGLKDEGVWRDLSVRRILKIADVMGTALTRVAADALSLANLPGASAISVKQGVPAQRVQNAFIQNSRSVFEITLMKLDTSKYVWSETSICGAALSKRESFWKAGKSVRNFGLHQKVSVRRERQEGGDAFVQEYALLRPCHGHVRQVYFVNGDQGV
jgi:hypothetical protein